MEKKNINTLKKKKKTEYVYQNEKKRRPSLNDDTTKYPLKMVF